MSPCGRRPLIVGSELAAEILVNALLDLLPSPHGRVGTQQQQTETALAVSIAVPSWSGRNIRAVLSLKTAYTRRRPLMVGSEPTMSTLCWCQIRRRRPLMVGSEQVEEKLQLAKRVCRRPLMVGSEHP